MEAAKLKEILEREYGIKNEEEFNEAVGKFRGIDLGIFNMPLNERRMNEQKTEAQGVA